MNAMQKIQKPTDVDGFQFFEIQGHNVRIFTQNLESDAHPLLICNGLGQAVEILFPMIAEFGDRPIISFDAVGVGKSSEPETPLGIVEHAAITAEILTRLGIESYDILGISWGGSVAQQLAYDDPTGCRKLILAITSAGGLGSWWGSPIALSELFIPLRYTSREYSNFISPFMYGGEAITSPGLFREYSKNSTPPSMKGYFGQVKAMCSWTSLGWLHELKQPTQIISGIFDALIPPANQMLLASRIPNAELHTFSAGHLLMYSKREEVGKLVTNFLDK